MSAKDRFHDAVKQGIQKEQWIITHDPLRIEFGANDIVKIDLGAESIVAAERTGQKIAVEIKSFLSKSALFDFHAALGQFLNYALVLELTEPESHSLFSRSDRNLHIFLSPRFTTCCYSAILC